MQAQWCVCTLNVCEKGKCPHGCVCGRERERVKEAPCNKVHTHADYNTVTVTTLCTVSSADCNGLYMAGLVHMGASSAVNDASHDTHTHPQHTRRRTHPTQTLLNYWGALCVFNLYRHSTMGVVIEPPVTNLRQSNQSKSKLIAPPSVQRELHIVYITYEYLFSQLNCKYLQSLKQIEKLLTKKQQVEQAERRKGG